MICKALKYFLLCSFLYSSDAPLRAMDRGRGYTQGLLGKRKHEGDHDPFMRPLRRLPPPLAVFAQAEDVFDRSTPSPPPLGVFTPVKGVFDRPTPCPSPLVEFTRAVKLAQGINRVGLSYDEVMTEETATQILNWFHTAEDFE